MCRYDNPLHVPMRTYGSQRGGERGGISMKKVNVHMDIERAVHKRKGREGKDNFVIKESGEWPKRLVKGYNVQTKCI